ncbi:prolipoprotein diacylglyceryl transferase [Candidatus Peribacteria bacterium]|jgi:phosphatidylglycerol---prolipoprotein diacylglyceryl transferase|nr:prolipoprotein diacylglyceryl transferase [Candidatus Peribacteria bacterium]MBT4020769.1 prolipoprotein diacylglyceryl transferase [Candidatus Peribacteria bacterium]MBT4241049.1 prolipoprotein diacylglyceryl transferase [Candidatus Peribacteria bacterium]MBT4474452.1 prolipoprotein diacylglyceryl transferase [Candidatus Peribacteria bacterium]
MSIFPTRQIFLEIGPLTIHWYGIMYMIAFLLVLWIVPRIKKYRDVHLSSEYLSTLLLYGIVGTIVGGRLGYVIFYGADYFGDNPLEIFMVWKGGMSSHGGIIGVAIAAWIFSKKHAIDIWRLADVLVIPAAIGLAFGRFGNFINQELYGSVTDLPWAISIPGEMDLRHPTQIYAIIKNLFITSVCFMHLKKYKKPGTTLGLFIILYGILRFLIEFIRVETSEGFDIAFMHLTRGQMLTVPLIVIGVWIMRTKRK